MTKKRKISEEINHILEELQDLDPCDEEYTLAAKNLNILCEAQNKRSPLIEYQVLIAGGIHLISIILIMKFEKFDVISTKAWTLIGRKLS